MPTSGSRVVGLLAAGWVAWMALAVEPARADAPDPFPEFRVPGQEPAMARLRALFRRHYGPRTATTLWDPWLPMAYVWPAVGPDGTAEAMRAYYRDTLQNRRIDDTGYVATQQHRGLAHADGWPFPTWHQSGGIGWHFSLAADGYAVMLGLKPTTALDGWARRDLEPLGIDAAAGARFRVTGPAPALTTPAFQVARLVSPFVKLDCGTSGPATPILDWIDQEPATDTGWASEPGPALGAADGMRLVMFRLRDAASNPHPLRRFRLRFQAGPGTEVTIRSLHTAIDTRHPINNLVFVMACADLFDGTTDGAFLKASLPRMRQALGFALDEFDIRETRGVRVPWVGHDGRSGLGIGPNGDKQIRPGVGVGNNYWDLLPFGGAYDGQATLYAMVALRRMAAIERWAAAQPPGAGLPAKGRFDPAELEALAAAVRDRARERLWNAQTGRFAGWIDVEGKAYDYGFSFLNLEAIVYGLASPEQARSILDWLDGRRIVTGDTSTGADIYHWRFGPRCTTRRNVETYVWPWSNPETIAWGNQVQDGGAVLAWSYFDLMARLAVQGPDDAWARLQAILAWFGEVEAEGGYRKYYATPGRGILQGGGPPGGLGLDEEFFESLLVPQVMLYGFLGVTPRPEGLAIAPRLPSSWPELTVSGVHLQGRVVDLTARRDAIVIRAVRGQGPLRIGLEPGSWQVEQAGSPARAVTSAERESGVVLDFAGGPEARFTRLGESR